MTSPAAAAQPPAEPPAPAGTVVLDSPGTNSYTVPEGVERVVVTAVGGAGASTSVTPGGPGARIRSELAVRPGEELFAVVGSSATGTSPGVNGGGAAAGCARPGGGGGGASDVRRVAPTEPDSAASRVVVAAGGGGAGADGQGTSAFGGPGGARDEVGRVGVGVPGGAPGSGGVGGAGEDLSGTATTGGAGGQQGAAGSGCGGGGGGGFGGGAGGRSGGDAAGAQGGGGGGGGGSLAADGSRWGRAADPDAAPSVTIAPKTQEIDPAALRVTSVVRPAFFGRASGPSSTRDCGAAIPARPERPECPVVSTSNVFDAGWARQLNWASSASVRPSYRPQPGYGLNPAPADTVTELGAPFPLADFAHWNISSRGTSIVETEFSGHVTVRPPAGEPVRLFHGVPSPGFPPSTPVLFLDTNNAVAVEQCDPSIQRSDEPCDDVFRLRDQPPPPPQTVNGVTWRVEVLGWDDGTGGVSRELITQERRTTVSRLMGRISVDTAPTTTTLAADDGAPLTATVAPRPTTGGTVTFRDTAGALPGCDAVPVDTATGIASCPRPAPGVADRPVTATYGGGVGFGPSTSAEVVLPGAGPGTVTPASGDGQSAPAGAAFARPLVAEVRDTLDRPFPGGEVTFTVTGGSASFGADATANATTGPDGRATAPALTAGPGPGPVTVVAAVEGVATPATYTLTVAPPPPAAPALVVRGGGTLATNGPPVSIGVDARVGADGTVAGRVAVSGPRAVTFSSRTVDTVTRAGSTMRITGTGVGADRRIAPYTLVVTDSGPRGDRITVRRGTTTVTGVLRTGDIAVR